MLSSELMTRWALVLTALAAAGTAHAEALSAGLTTIFPLPGAARAGTPFVEGRYGAFRPHARAPGCGRGHCGVDLHAPDGTPVIALMDGYVDQVERSSSGIGGRWVRIAHEDGRATWYMHLARIREDLAHGTRISAGEVLGTLGRTGVHNSPTHLHFAVSVGARGRHLDPMPLLAGATLVPEPIPPL